MKRTIQIIIFITTFIIILLIDFLVYKNIDKIIPTHQNEIYTFANHTKEQKYNFIFEMLMQIEETGNYKKILDNVELLKEKNLNSNIITNYVYKEVLEEDWQYIPLYEGSLDNTVYGDLKFITSRSYFKSNYNKIKEVYTNFYIVYSDDMKKVCYYNFDNDKGLEANDYSIKIKENSASLGYEIKDELSEYDDSEENNEKQSTESSKKKEELIKDVKEEFRKMNSNIDIQPNTIIKKTNFYILQDEQNKATIYYDDENNLIFGFCIGFEN